MFLVTIVIYTELFANYLGAPIFQHAVGVLVFLMKRFINLASFPLQNGKTTDSYCMELLSMLLQLSGTPSGAAHLAQQLELLEALVILLHTTTDAVQLQVLSLLTHIMAHVQPSSFAFVLGGASIPPSGYSAIMHAQQVSAGVGSSSAEEILDIFLACISKV